MSERKHQLLCERSIGLTIVIRHKFNSDDARELVMSRYSISLLPAAQRHNVSFEYCCLGIVYSPTLPIESTHFVVAFARIRFQ